MALNHNRLFVNGDGSHLNLHNKPYPFLLCLSWKPQTGLPVPPPAHTFLSFDFSWRWQLRSDLCHLRELLGFPGSPICLHDHHACVLSHIQLFATPQTVAQQASLSMGFSRQEYWSGLPIPPPGDLPQPRIKPLSPVSLHWQADSLPLKHLGSPYEALLLKGFPGGTVVKNPQPM